MYISDIMMDMGPYEEDSMGRLCKAMDSGDVNTVLSFALEESEPAAIRTSAMSMLPKTVKKAVENGDRALVEKVLERLKGVAGAGSVSEKIQGALGDNKEYSGMMKPAPGTAFAKKPTIPRGPKKQRC
jgi:hypothetical protein